MKGEAMSITEFLLARIAEDEAVAQSASPGPWSFSDIDSVGGGTIYDPTVAIANVEWDNGHVDARIRRTRPSGQADATGAHIARHDPARVLAECAAKRAIIGAHPLHLYLTVEGWDMWECLNCERSPCDTLKALASVYKDHPDYRPEWAL